MYYATYSTFRWPWLSENLRLFVTVLKHLNQQVVVAHLQFYFGKQVTSLNTRKTSKQIVFNFSPLHCQRVLECADCIPTKDLAYRVHACILAYDYCLPIGPSVNKANV